MKKNNPFRDLFYRSLKKTLLIMRIAIILMILGILQARASDAYSQNTRLSLNFSETELVKVLDKIEVESEFFFLYNEKLLDTDRKVNIIENDQLINVILDNLFAGTDVKYTIIDRKIILSPDYLNEMPAQQQKIITGTITDENGNPLPGVNIQVEGTTIGSISDINGKYSINIPREEAVLVFSFFGYNLEKVSVAGKVSVDVQLTPDIKALEEVVVIGYGTVKKSDITGSVVSVKGKDISLQAVSNPVQALAGISSGVQVLQESGQPGTALSVLIRGGNSLLGSNSPLYVIDGFPIVGDLSSVNSNDIMSLEILKDASATAIYGSRGANGVILVTTKKGQEGKTTIEYNGYYGVQKVANTIDMLNAKEFATLANVRALNDNMAPYFTDSEIASFSEGTDWQDEVFQLAPIQDHSLAISGGNSKTLFNVSGSYFDQDGIILNSWYKRYQFRPSIEHKITKNWKISSNNILSYSNSNNLFSNNTERGAGVLSGALIAPPTVSVKDSEGNYNNVRAYSFSPDILENPVAMALERKDQTTVKSALLNLSTQGTLIKDLVFYASIGLDYQNSRRDFYSPKIFQPSATGSALISVNEYLDLISENHLTYTKKVGANHEFKAMGAFTAQEAVTQFVSSSSTGYLSDKLENYSLQSGSTFGTPTSSYSRYALLSYLGRVNYSFMEKYLITASIRSDGSSRMGADNKWGYFPSAAAAWKISKEGFLKDNSTISNLKLRASWGQTGNTAVSPYQSLSILSSSQTVFDNSIVIGYAPGTAMPNPNLKWESTTQIDIGLDAGLLDDRINLSLDYYHKLTDDLLASIPVTLSSGYSTQSTNLGSIENEGFELSANSVVINRTFQWNLGFIASFNRNEVISLAGGTDIFGVSLGNALPAMSLVREGYPVGVFFGYVEDGLTEDGLIKYADLDQNGIINSLDRSIIGDPNPDFTFGLTSDMSYKGFGLTVLVNGVQGNDILNYNLSNVADGFSFGINQMQDVLGNYWTKENPNPNARYPKISKNTRYQGSDRFIEDGSYIQLKNVKLSYTLNGERFSSSPFFNSQIFLNFQNLLTFTKYSFYTPTMNTRGGGISKGIDQFGYPDARTIMLGVKIIL